jgi:hypothetical protein
MWVKHTGDECPVPPDTMVKVSFGCNWVDPGFERADFWYWGPADEGCRITEYWVAPSRPLVFSLRILRASLKDYKKSRSKVDGYTALFLARRLVRMLEEALDE